jgi:hypothetical protein
MNDRKLVGYGTEYSVVPTTGPFCSYLFPQIQIPAGRLLVSSAGGEADCSGTRIKRMESVLAYDSRYLAVRISALGV